MRLAKLTSCSSTISLTIDFLDTLLPLLRLPLLLELLAVRDDARGKCVKIILPDDSPRKAFEFDTHLHDVTYSCSSKFPFRTSGDTMLGSSGKTREHKNDSPFRHLFPSISDNGCRKRKLNKHPRVVLKHTFIGSSKLWSFSITSTPTIPPHISGTTTCSTSPLNGSHHKRLRLVIE